MLDQQHALPEAVDAAVLELFAGARQLDLLFEYGDAAALDAEDVEEVVPEALRLGALRGLALPLARERDRARLDLVPGQRHVRPPVFAHPWADDVAPATDRIASACRARGRHW